MRNIVRRLGHWSKRIPINWLRYWLFSRGLILIFLVGIIPITWFKGNFLIAGGDYFPVVFPKLSLNNSLFVWSLEGLGALPKASPKLLLNVVHFLFQEVGLGPVVWEQIAFYFIIVSAGISMFYLTFTISDKRKLAPVLSGLFYMTNFWALISLWTVPYTFTFNGTFAFSFFPSWSPYLLKV